MRSASPSSTPPTRSHRPRAFTVFAAAFVAGAAAAVGVNSVLDVRLAQAKPRVESEPIFVALRSLPQGAPVTVWDVALRDWPRAMVPTTALRASDAFSGLVLKHPLREGQPLLSIQLVESESRPAANVSITAVSAPATAVVRTPEADLWAPAEPSVPATETAMPAPQPAPEQQPTQPRIESSPQPVVQAQPQAQPQSQSQAQPDAQAARGTDQPLPAPPTAAAIVPDTAAVATASVMPSAAAADTSPAADTIAAADPADDETVMVDDAITDEVLESLAATTTPPTTGPVAAPAEGAAAAPVAAAPVERAAAEPTPTQEATPEPTAPRDAATDPAAVAAQPAPTPTLADPPPTAVENSTYPGDATAPASVMLRPTGEGDRPPAPVAVQPRVATRYLVVPESIAVQADSSFVAPQQPSLQPATRSAAEAVKPLPPAAAAPGGNRPTSQPAGQPMHQRASQPRRGTSAAAGQQPAAPQSTAPPTRRGMFPNIAAGIESIEGEMTRMRRERAGQPEPAAVPRPRPTY